MGGFIAGSRAVVDYLKHTARPFVFSASLPAASVAAAAAALEIIKQGAGAAHCGCCASPNMLREELRARGFSVLDGETAIVPVVIREEMDLCRLCKALLEEGIYINPVLKPAARAEPAAHLLHRRAHRSAHRQASHDAYEGGGAPRHRALN